MAELRDRATTDDGSPRASYVAGGVAALAAVVGLVLWRRRG